MYILVLAIIREEKKQAYWRKLNYSMAKPCGCSAKVVSEKSDNDKMTEFEGQSTVKEAI